MIRTGFTIFYPDQNSSGIINDSAILQPEKYINDSGILTEVKPEVKTFFPDLGFSPEQLAAIGQTDLSQLGDLKIDVVPTLNDINISTENGGQVVKPDGTVILNNGTIIEPQVNEQYNNVQINNDGSITLPDGNVIAPLPDKTVIITIDNKIFESDSNIINPNEEIKTDILKEIIIETPEKPIIYGEKKIKEKPVIKQTFLDQLTNYFYKLIYK
jgi:hypothetical protein